jgi:hypothetical protein
MKAICGICGTNETSKGGFCKHGHDHWIELQDFDNPALKMHIHRGMANMNVTKEELKKAVEKEISLEDKVQKMVIDADNQKCIGYFKVSETEETKAKYETMNKWNDISIDRNGDLILWEE